MDLFELEADCSYVDEAEDPKADQVAGTAAGDPEEVKKDIDYYNHNWGAGNKFQGCTGVRVDSLDEACRQGGEDPARASDGRGQEVACHMKNDR